MGKKWSSFKEQQLLTENFRKWVEEPSIVEQEKLHEILDPMSQTTLLSLAAFGTIGAAAVAAGAGSIAVAAGALSPAIEKVKNWMRDKKFKKGASEVERWLEQQPGYIEAAAVMKTSSENIVSIQQELSMARTTLGKPNVKELTRTVSALMKRRNAALEKLNNIFKEVKELPEFNEYFATLDRVQSAGSIEAGFKPYPDGTVPKGVPRAANLSKELGISEE